MYTFNITHHCKKSAAVDNNLMNKWALVFCGLIICVFSQSVNAIAFDTNEVIILKGKGKELAEDEGYLYLTIDTQTEFEYFTIWHVDGGKQLRFDSVSKGKHQALIKLKAGDYY